MFLRIGELALVFTFILSFSGCGAEHYGIVMCSTITELAVAPGGMVLDHTSPGNQWTFMAFGVYDRSSGCLDHVSPPLENTAWSASDSENVSLAPGPGADKATVTCLAATSTPVIITVTSIVNAHNVVTGTGTLICK